MQRRYFSITCFWAHKESTLSNLFEKGHQKVLSDHGINVQSGFSSAWKKQKNIIVLLVMEADESVAGIRLELKDNRYPMSIVNSLHNIEPELNNKFSEMNLSAYGEACGLWNARSAAGLNLPLMLARSCLGISKLLGLDKMVSFNANHTRRISEDMGGEVFKSVGENGIIFYPDHRFKSMIYFFNTVTFENASTECQSYLELFITKIKSNPSSSFEFGEHRIKLRYNL